MPAKPYNVAVAIRAVAICCGAGALINKPPRWQTSPRCGEFYRGGPVRFNVGNIHMKEVSTPAHNAGAPQEESRMLSRTENMVEGEVVGSGANSSRVWGQGRVGWGVGKF